MVSRWARDRAARKSGTETGREERFVKPFTVDSGEGVIGRDLIEGLVVSIPQNAGFFRRDNLSKHIGERSGKTIATFRAISGSGEATAAVYA